MPKGHREAAQVLGLSPLQSFRRIVLPQAVRMTLPPLASNFVQLIKFSSLGAVISVSEITRRGMELSRHQLPAAGDLHLHRRGLFLHLLAARHGDPLVGTPAAEPLMPSACRCATQLARRVDAARERLIAATQRLVAVASPNPPSDTHDVAAVAEALLREIPGIEVERIEPAPRVVSLVGRIRGARPGRRLIFNGHLDTFPIREDLAWTVPPLGGVLKDGKLYGRGVCDMKGGIACSLLAATLLAEHRDAWSGEIVLTLAGDEENMGSLGTGYMLEHIPHARGDANICGDVGSPRVVRFGEKGLMWVEVEATGSPAHGAHVHRGVNAIDRLRDRARSAEGARDDPLPRAGRRHRGDQQRQGDLGGAVGRRRGRHAVARHRQYRHHRGRHLAQPGADACHRPRRHPPAGRHHHRPAGAKARRMAGAARRA